MSKLDAIRERVNTLTVNTSIAAIDRAYLLKRVESLERALREQAYWSAPDGPCFCGRQGPPNNTHEAWCVQARAALAELEE